jgi:formylglycine-generating enzyme required for sulfatase activity
MRVAPFKIALAAVAGAALGLAAYAVGQARAPALTPQMAQYQMPDGTEILVQRHEVSLADWSLCHAEGGCALALRAPVGRVAADYPATGLSWVDATEYLRWINARTGRAYRLPRVAEWRAMAAPVLPAKPDPIFTDPALSWASAYLTEGLGSRRLEPSGSYSVTAEGIADLDGNVWEWTSDCFTDGGAAISAERCPAFYVMGVHEAVMSYLVRDPARGGCATGSPPAHLGLRLVLDDARAAQRKTGEGAD